MRKLFTAFCLSLFSVFSFAQNTIQVQKPYVEIRDSVPARSEEGQDSLKLIDEYLKTAQYRCALALLDSMNLTDTLLEKKAICHVNLYEYPQAIAILYKLSRENTGNIPVRLRLASIYEAVQKYSLALACYEELMELDPANDYYKIQKANSLYACEKINQALEQYKALCDSCDNVYLLKRLAMCYEKLNNDKSARYYYAMAWDQDTTDVYAAASLVKLLIKGGQYELAKFASDRYIAFDSTYNTMNSLNAYAYYNLNMYKEAAQRFEKCLQRGDSSLFVTRGLGTTYFFMENDSLANPMLELAYKADTTNSQVLYALAQTCFNLEKYQDAIKYYEILLEKDIPSDYKLYRYYSAIGDAYHKGGRLEPAVRSFFMASARTTDNEEHMILYEKLANIYDYELNSYLNAVNYYNKYRVTLLNSEISLGGVEDDLSKLELSEDTISKIKDMRLKIARVDERLDSLKELMPKGLSGRLQDTNIRKVVEIIENGKLLNSNREDTSRVSKDSIVVQTK